MKGYIYKLTAPNGKVYIGQTVDIKRRFSEYGKKNGAINQRKLYNSIKKYGWKNFDKTILFQGDCTIKFLNDLEIYYINKFNSSKNGLNIQLGGINGLHSEETKIKMSISAKKLCSNKDYTLNRNSHWKGRKHSKETKLKMSKAKKGRVMSPEWLKKISISLLENNSGKLVLNTETGIYYDSCKRASDSISHIKYTTLKNKINGCKKNNTSFIYV